MPEPRYEKSLVWFRRDLRDYAHAALYHALKSSCRVYCAFVFDTEILDRLADKADRRVEFIWESVRELQSTLRGNAGDFIVRHGAARSEIPALAQQLGVQAVFCNRDYEPARDAAVAEALAAQGIAFHPFKDQVIFNCDEVLTQTGKPFGVFTPYKNAWLRKLEPFYLTAYPVEHYLDRLITPPFPCHMLALEDLGFQRTNLSALKLPTGMSGAARLFEDFWQRMERYAEARDFPAVKGPSYLSVHLRFGTISIRQLARAAWELGGRGAETWLSELI